MAKHETAVAKDAAPIARLLSIKQATATLGIGRTLAYELISFGKLKTVRIGRRRFVPREAIETFLDSLKS